MNLPGGKSLYAPEQFEEEGIKLTFIEPKLTPYPQFTPPFTSGLSILGLIMFNERVKVIDMLKDYRLETVN